MNTLLDRLLVGALLVASMGYAIWALGPRLFRVRLLLTLGRSFQTVAGLRALGERFLAAAERKQPGCGGCEGCAPTPPAASRREIRIPVGKIGRRS